MGAVGDKIGAVVSGGFDTLAAVAALPGQIVEGVGGAVGFAQYIPFILIAVLAVALFFIFKNPHLLKAFL